ncbi:MAG: hypothetical protein ABIP30_12890 [Ferruginibacter sp.]
MKLKHFFYTVAVLFSFTVVKAQTNVPADFTKGSVTLADGKVVTGFIKDNMKKFASITFLDNEGNNKKNYEGSDINAVSIDNTNYMCLSGDFFKTICIGRINFLQKVSNAAGKSTYNGTEAIFNNGTEGKVNDYFTYSNNSLKLLNKKTVESFINNDLASNPLAVQNAKANKGDISKLEEAVKIYNSSN